jgi:hypothetical protein
MITPARGTHPDTEKPNAAVLARRNLNIRFGLLISVSDAPVVLLIRGSNNYFHSQRHSFGAPSGTSFPSVRMVLSEPFGAACIPDGVSPCGLDAGAPPDLVLSGPVFP